MERMKGLFRLADDAAASGTASRALLRADCAPATRPRALPLQPRASVPKGINFPLQPQAYFNHERPQR